MPKSTIVPCKMRTIRKIKTKKMTNEGEIMIDSGDVHQEVYDKIVDLEQPTERIDNTDRLL